MFTCVWNAYVSWDRHLVRLDAGREYQAREELKKEALAQCRGEVKCGEELGAEFERFLAQHADDFKDGSAGDTEK